MSDMEENDAMEGKDLALNEVIKDAFESKKESDLKGEENFVNPVLQIGETSFEIDIKRDDKDNRYKMHILGVHILTLDENNELQFEQGWEETLSNRIKECGDMISEKDGKDLIENLKQVDKELHKQKEEEQKDERDLSKDMSEKEDDEKEPKEEEEKEKDDEEKEEKPKEQKKNLIKLNDKVIKVLCPSAKEYGGIYLDPDRGEIVGKNRSTHEIEPVRGLSQIKGTSSNKNIHGMEDGKHKHVNAFRMYQIDSRPNTGFSITRDGTEKGNFDVKYTTRKVDSNDIKDFAYVDIPLLASQTRMGEGRAKEVSGVRQGRRGQGEQDRVQDEVDELNEEIEVPEDIVNSFNDEMQRQSNNITSLKQFKDMLYEVVKEKLDKERPNDFPDSHIKHAEQIVDAMVEENEDYEEAKDEIYSGNEKENDNDNERQLGDNPRKREH